MRAGAMKEAIHGVIPDPRQDTAALMDENRDGEAFTSSPRFRLMTCFTDSRIRLRRIIQKCTRM